MNIKYNELLYLRNYITDKIALFEINKIIYKMKKMGNHNIKLDCNTRLEKRIYNSLILAAYTIPIIFDNDKNCNNLSLFYKVVNAFSRLNREHVCRDIH